LRTSNREDVRRALKIKSGYVAVGTLDDNTKDLKCSLILNLGIS